MRNNCFCACITHIYKASHSSDLVLLETIQQGILHICPRGVIVSRCLRLSERSKMTSVVEHIKSRWRYTSFTKPIWRLTQCKEINKEPHLFSLEKKTSTHCIIPLLKLSETPSIFKGKTRPLKMRFVFTFPPHWKCDSLMRSEHKEHRQFLSTQRFIYSSLFIMQRQSFPQNSSCLMRQTTLPSPFVHKICCPVSDTSDVNNQSAITKLHQLFITAFSYNASNENICLL